MAILIGFCGTEEVMFDIINSRYPKIEDLEDNIDLSPEDLLAGLPSSFGVLYLPPEFPRDQGIYSASSLTKYIIVLDRQREQPHAYLIMPIINNHTEVYDYKLSKEQLNIAVRTDHAQLSRMLKTRTHYLVSKPDVRIDVKVPTFAKPSIASGKNKFAPLKKASKP